MQTDQQQTMIQTKHPQNHNCSKLVASLSLSLFLSFHCQQTAPQRLHLGQGQEEFIFAAQQMQEPQGILPQQPLYTCPQESAVLFKEPSKWDQFFLADTRTTLILLSIDPIRFVKIESDLFYQRILRELNQIRRRYEGKDKKISAQPFFKEIGSYKVEIYFTPRELNYSLSSLSSYRYRLRQANSAHRPRPDLWRLIEAAQYVNLSYPQFEDEQMLKDFHEQRQLGKIRHIATATSALAPSLTGDDLIATSNDLQPFAYIFGRQLEVTENLLDSGFLPTNDLSDLTNNFLALFSLPPGNPYSAAPALNVKDGIVVVIRGDTEQLAGELDLPLFPNSAVTDSTVTDSTFTNSIATNSIATSSTVADSTDGEANSSDSAASSHFSKTWCQSAPPLLRAPSGCLASLKGVYLSELGDNSHPDDYVELYNSNNECVDLGFIEAYIQRDFGCKIAEGDLSGKYRLRGILPPGAYMAFGERGNRLGLREQFADSFTLDGKRYCLALTTRDRPLRAHDDEQIADLVIFGEAGDSGGSPTGIFSRGRSASRCWQREERLEGERDEEKAGSWKMEREQTPDRENDCSEE